MSESQEKLCTYSYSDVDKNYINEYLTKTWERSIKN